MKSVNKMVIKKGEDIESLKRNKREDIKLAKVMRSSKNREL